MGRVAGVGGVEGVDGGGGVIGGGDDGYGEEVAEDDG